MPETASKNVILWFFIALFLVSFYLIGKLLWPFLSIIVIAAVVTGLFSPLFRFMTLTDKITPPFASFLTCVVIFFVLFIPIAFFVGVLSKEAYGLYIAAKNAVLGNQIQQILEGNIWVEKTKVFLARFNIDITGEQMKGMVSQLARIVGFFLYDQARSIASNMFTFIINFILMLLVIYYLLIDGQRLVDFIIGISPLPDDQNQALFKKFKDMAGAVIIGNGLGGMIQGILGGLVFAFFGFSSPFLWGVIMGLLAFLPIVGIGLVFIPAAIYLFLTSKTAAAIFFIIFWALLSGMVEYLFKPKVVGHRVQMHTLLVFFSIIGGLKLFGILGIIYGPLVVTGFLTLTDMYHTSYQQMIEFADP